MRRKRRLGCRSLCERCSLLGREWVEPDRDHLVFLRRDEARRRLPAGHDDQPRPVLHSAYEVADEVARGVVEPMDVLEDEESRREEANPEQLADGVD